MGVWGMGLTQSDVFCEVYDRFMERYNQGEEVSTIVSEILEEYHREFSEDDGVLHDVYFALAKAEWMCCAQSERVLSRVNRIIQTDANIAFYRELEATEADLKLRRKNLAKFWEALQTPRAKPRQRRIDPLDRVKELPPVQPGECYAYRHEEGYRVLIILDRFKEEGWLEQVCCAVLKNTFSTLDIAIPEERISFISTYVGIEFLAKSHLKKIGQIPLPEHFRNRIPQHYISWFGRKRSFHDYTYNPFDITLSKLLKTHRSIDSK